MSLTCTHIESISWALRKDSIILKIIKSDAIVYKSIKNIKTKKSLNYIRY